MSFYNSKQTPVHSPDDRDVFSSNNSYDAPFYSHSSNERNDIGSSMPDNDPYVSISEPFSQSSQFHSMSPEIGEMPRYYNKFSSGNGSNGGRQQDSFSQDYSQRRPSDTKQYKYYDSYGDTFNDQYAYTDPVQGSYTYGSDPIYQSTVNTRYSYSPYPNSFSRSPIPSNANQNPGFVYDDNYSDSISSNYTNEDMYSSTQKHRNNYYSNKRNGLSDYNTLNSIFETEPSALQPNEQFENNYRTNVSLEVDIGRIRSGEDTRTTLMIKNIPNSFTQTLMIRIINNYSYNKYNFFYLPIDYNTHCNYGYAYINLLSSKYVEDFISNFDGRRWPKTPSKKICKITFAKIQGMVHMRSKAKESMIMQLPPEFRPLFFIQNKTYYHDKSYTSLKSVSITEFFNAYGNPALVPPIGSASNTILMNTKSNSLSPPVGTPLSNVQSRSLSVSTTPPLSNINDIQTDCTPISTSINSLNTSGIQNEKSQSN